MPEPTVADRMPPGPIPTRGLGGEGGGPKGRKPLRIALDIDGVLADFSMAFTLLARGLGLHHKPAWGADLQPRWGYDFHVDPVWEALYAIPNWWMTLPSLMTPRDVEAINEAIRADTLIFVTARLETNPFGPYGNQPGKGSSIEAQTRNWLKSMGVFWTAKICMAAEDKGEACLEEGITHALDDHPMALLDMDKVGVNAWVMDRPYNRSELPLFNRVTSVSAFLQAVQEDYQSGNPAYRPGEDLSLGAPPHG